MNRTQAAQIAAVAASGLQSIVNDTAFWKELADSGFEVDGLDADGLAEKLSHLAFEIRHFATSIKPVHCPHCGGEHLAKDCGWSGP